jgi:hypothetical protein
MKNKFNFGIEAKALLKNRMEIIHFLHEQETFFMKEERHGYVKNKMLNTIGNIIYLVWLKIHVSQQFTRLL